MQVHVLAVDAGAVRPEVAAVPATSAAHAARARRRLAAELEDAPVRLQEALRQARAARVQVQVLVEAVVDEAAHAVAAGVEDPALGVRGREEEHERGVAEHGVLQGGRWSGAAGVEVEVAALVLAPVPDAGAVPGFQAAVARERPVVGVHQLQLVVLRVGWVARDHRRNDVVRYRHGRLLLRPSSSTLEPFLIYMSDEH